MKYLNLGGNSGVDQFEIEDESIKIQFTDRSVYLYTYESAGSGNIEKMKDLARAGRGLNAFINKTVKYRYFAKIR